MWIISDLTHTHWPMMTAAMVRMTNAFLLKQDWTSLALRFCTAFRARTDRAVILSRICCMRLPERCVSPLLCVIAASPILLKHTDHKKHSCSNHPHQLWRTGSAAHLTWLRTKTPAEPYTHTQTHTLLSTRTLYQISVHATPTRDVLFCRLLFFSSSEGSRSSSTGPETHQVTP